MRRRARDLDDFEALGRRDGREGLPRRNVAGLCPTGQAEDYYEVGYLDGLAVRRSIVARNFRIPTP